MRIALIDYGAGNLHSALKALECASAACGVDSEIVVGSAPEMVAAADRIVLPGDGAFADCIGHLRAIPGLDEALFEAVRRRGRPFLGICVGMQLLATTGLEYGETAGLGWLPGLVRRIEPTEDSLKIPHMGWNTLHSRSSHKLLDGIPLGDKGWHAYFLHAYHLVPDTAADVIAEADYGGPITAVVARGNIAGTQFHPEKSQALGLGILCNFLTWSP